MGVRYALLERGERGTPIYTPDAMTPGGTGLVATDTHCRLRFRHRGSMRDQDGGMSIVLDRPVLRGVAPLARCPDH